MKPAIPFAKTDQARLRSLQLHQSQVPVPGRVMFCRGRAVLGYGDVEKLGDFLYIPKHTDTVCLSAADFDDVKGWLG